MGQQRMLVAWPYTDQVTDRNKTHCFISGRTREDAVHSFSTLNCLYHIVDSLSGRENHVEWHDRLCKDVLGLIQQAISRFAGCKFDIEFECDLGKHDAQFDQSQLLSDTTVSSNVEGKERVFAKYQIRLRRPSFGNKLIRPGESFWSCAMSATPYKITFYLHLCMV